MAVNPIIDLWRFFNERKMTKYCLCFGIEGYPRINVPTVIDACESIRTFENGLLNPSSIIMEPRKKCTYGIYTSKRNFLEGKSSLKITFCYWSD
ncbi:MAG: hypothetical protein M1323_03880 [Candidatus Thermoplasmatota archaeon]|jgi:hypothetical protein|nr:hypothetical protein [Candidatus Thermoplasmatota archaeon]